MTFSIRIILMAFFPTLQLQINSCGDSLLSNLAIHQVQFIRTLCMRLIKDPRLADFFIKVGYFKCFI